MKSKILLIISILCLIFTVYAGIDSVYEGDCPGLYRTVLGSGIKHLIVNQRFFVPADTSQSEYGCAISTRIFPIDLVLITVALFYSTWLVRKHENIGSNPLGPVPPSKAGGGRTSNNE